MSKKQFKAQASSSRAFSSAGAFGGGLSGTSTFGSASSTLSYLAEQPDLTAVSDSNVVVSFKNLSKKDSTTKAKALEDIQNYVTGLIEQKGDPEEALLEAWVKVYPRISTDVSRRVRQLSHTLQGQISQCSGKRIAKHMPSIVGAWTAGLHDTDKPVARAAEEALQTVFSTPEKQSNVFKVYHQAILEFARDALLNESEKTLSDERTTTPEDAAAKYQRLIASCIALVDDLIIRLSEQEVQKQGAIYDELLQESKFWDFASSKDSSVRRVLLRLLRTCMQKRKETINTNISHITEALLSKQTVKNQAGSALEYTQSLLALTSTYPELWSEKLQGKTSPITRLADLAKAGSQGASSEFWLNIARICRFVPDTALPTEKEEIVKLCSSVHTGVTRKDEHRTNINDAWTCYISLCVRLSSQLSEEEQKRLLKETVFPLVQQYLTPTPEASQWSLPSTKGAAIVASILQNTTMASVAESEWDTLAENLLEKIQTSAPEQSKDYSSSQSSVAAQGTRLFTLAGQLEQNNASEELMAEIYRTSGAILSGCLHSIESRKGKPYGAAGVVEIMVQSLRKTFFTKQELSQPLNKFIDEKLPEIVTSPSGPHFVRVLLQCAGQPGFEERWNRTLNSALNSPDAPQKMQVVVQLLSSPSTPSGASNNTNLQAFITRNMQRALAGDQDWASVGDLLGSKVDTLSTATSDELLSNMMHGLAIESMSVNAMSGINLIATRNQSLLKQFLQGAEGATLLQRLLSLTESQTETIASAATETSRLVQTAGTSGVNGASSTVTIVQAGLYEANSNSLSVETLSELARSHISTTDSIEPEKLEQVLPSTDKWSQLVQESLYATPAEAFAMTNQLGGAIYLLQEHDSSASSMSNSFDKDGRSAIVRIALFLLELTKEKTAFSSLSVARRAEVFRLLLLTVQLISDSITLTGAHALWTRSDPTLEAEMSDLLSDAQSLLKQWQTDPAIFASARDTFSRASEGLDPISYQNARAFGYMVSEHVELHGSKSLDNVESTMKTLRTSKGNDSLEFASTLVAYKPVLSSNPTYARLCNEMVANLTGVDLSKSTTEALRQLIYLNLMLQDQEHVVDTIAKQRLIFFVKHIVSWLHDELAITPLLAEVCKLLVILLPAMKDVYGEHWQSVIDFLSSFWAELPQLNTQIAGTAIVPLVHASLKMLAMLRKLLRDDESNDDVKDAWQESLPKLTSGLMNVLIQLGQVPDDNNQPLSIANELLGRQISAMPVAKTQNVQELFPLMMAESQHVQRIAFELLHKAVPAAQEELSVNVLLDKIDAHLPEELLSLVLDPPTLDSLADASFERTMPLSLRSYLSSWLLIFDHFKNSSDKVKNDYINHLKSGDYLSGLLAFTFDFLGHSIAKPLDPSGLAIEYYSFDIEPSPVRDTHWLLCHLYYLCLKRLPTLSKTWWMDCKSRQTVQSVESWTEKYISPLITTDALNTVSTWSETQSSLPEEEQLIIKPNLRTKEITISKEIDEQNLSLLIKLPSNYPLGQATLIGLNRVGVPEKKWRSWLLNSQGVIAFSNNSLIDGIVAFRRNVVGMMKGQSECAICYSVVGPAKELPGKKCATCKNAFHGSCLYRWFKSSNSSSCPLCRTSFLYA